MASKLNGAELQGMVRHWLTVPPNGYLGSDYGSDPQSLLQNPQVSGMGDAFIRKMEKDVPMIQALPKGAVEVALEDKGNDAKILHIDVLDSKVTVSNSGDIA